MLKLSATSIKTYLTCPRQYRYRYVEEIPTPLTGPLAFGRVIHTTLHQLHLHSIATGSELDLAYGLSEFERLWQEILETETPCFNGKNPTEHDAAIEQYRLLGKQILTRYVYAESKLPPPLLLEFPFELHWQGNGQECLLCGTIDRIDEGVPTGSNNNGDNSNGTSGLVIIDYKSSQRKPAIDALDQDVQFTLYAFAVEQTLGQSVQRIVYYHLRSQIGILTLRSREDLHQFCEESLPAIVRAIESQRFTPQPGYWCRWCPYQEPCRQEGFF